MSFSETQWKSLAIAPKITASLSIIGSLYVIRDVVTSSKKRKLVYHSILLYLCSIDLIIGICMFLSTWPIPAGSAGSVYGAVGNTATCTAQGYFLQLSIMGPLYNASLSLYYLLMIRYNWTEEQLRRLRYPIHGIILIFGIGTSIAGLPLTLYNNANLWCWQASYPAGCIETAQSTNDKPTTCQRGDNALSIYRWTFFYGPLWAAILFATIATIMVFLKVYHVEMASQRFQQQQSQQSSTTNTTHSFSLRSGTTTTTNIHNSRQRNNTMSLIIMRPKRKKRARMVAYQALYYVGAFYAAWVFPTLNRIIQSINGQTYYPIVLLMSIFLPLQGLLNALVYVRPRYQRYIQRHPDWSFKSAIKEAMIELFGCNKNMSEGEEEDTDEIRSIDYNVAPLSAFASRETRLSLEEEEEEKEEEDNDEDIHHEQSPSEMENVRTTESKEITGNTTTNVSSSTRTTVRFKEEEDEEESGVIHSTENRTMSDDCFDENNV